MLFLLSRLKRCRCWNPRQQQLLWYLKLNDNKYKFPTIYKTFYEVTKKTPIKINCHIRKFFIYFKIFLFYVEIQCRLLLFITTRDEEFGFPLQDPLKLRAKSSVLRIKENLVFQKTHHHHQREHRYPQPPKDFPFFFFIIIFFLQPHKSPVALLRLQRKLTYPTLVNHHHAEHSPTP